MQLKNDIESFGILFNSISNFYEGSGRDVLIFEALHPECDSDYFVRFLVEKKTVCEYRISFDRGFLLSVVSVAIGPHYFVPAEFWDYKNSQRFLLEASSDAVVHNLKILDEYISL